MSTALEARSGEKEALALVGLARKGGRAVVGPEALEREARSGRLAAVVVAGDAPQNARARVARALRLVDVTRLELADRERLGVAVGRHTAIAVGLTDRGLAERVAALAGREPAAPSGEPEGEPEKRDSASEEDSP